MPQVIIEMPNESLMPFDGSQERTSRELRMAAAAKLYEMGRLSSGAAARLADIPRTLFLTRLAEYGINTFQFNENEWAKETRLV